MNPLSVSALSAMMFLAFYVVIVIALKVVAILTAGHPAGQALAFITF